MPTASGQATRLTAQRSLLPRRILKWLQQLGVDNITRARLSNGAVFASITHAYLPHILPSHAIDAGASSSAHKAANWSMIERTLRQVSVQLPSALQQSVALGQGGASEQLLVLFYELFTSRRISGALPDVDCPSAEFAIDAAYLPDYARQTAASALRARVRRISVQETLKCGGLVPCSEFSDIERRRAESALDAYKHWRRFLRDASCGRESFSVEIVELDASNADEATSSSSADSEDVTAAATKWSTGAEISISDRESEARQRLSRRRLAEYNRQFEHELR